MYYNMSSELDVFRMAEGIGENKRALVVREHCRAQGKTPVQHQRRRCSRLRSWKQQWLLTCPRQLWLATQTPHMSLRAFADLSYRIPWTGPPESPTHGPPRNSTPGAPTADKTAPMNLDFFLSGAMIQVRVRYRLGPLDIRASNQSRDNSHTVAVGEMVERPP